MSTSIPDRDVPALGSHHDWWVSLGIAVSAVSAGFSSFAGLRSLAEVTGWGGMAPLFALCVDAYALTAIRVWLTTSERSAFARAFAKWNAIGAILLSLAGNAVWHLIGARLLEVTWHVVMAVGAVPPVILGLVSHLAVLRRQAVQDRPEVAARTEDVPRPAQPQATAPAAQSVPAPPRTKPTKTAPPKRAMASLDEAGLLTKAKEADAKYRAEHDGRPITRDALRRSLHIGGDRATALLRHLRAESGTKPPLSIPHQQES